MPAYSELRTPALPQDEGTILVYPIQILHGGVPNRSFESIYGEGAYLPVMAAFTLTGASVTSERLVGLLYQIMLVASLAVLVGRRRGPLIGCLAGVIAAVVAEKNGLPAYAWSGGLALAAVGVVLTDIAVARHPRRLLLAVAGLCFGLAVSYRLEFGLAIGAFLVALWFVRGRPLLWVLPGAAIGLTPFLVNVSQAGVSAVLRGQVEQPVFTASPDRRIPLTSVGAAVFLVLAVTTLAAFALIAFAVAVSRHDGWTWEAAMLLAVGLFEVILLPQAFQRADRIHVAYVACSVVSSALMIPLSLNWSAALGLGLLLAVAPVAAGAALHSLEPRRHESFPVSNDGRTVPVATATDQSDVHHLLQAIDARSRPGDRVFVGPGDLRYAGYEDTDLYFLLPALRPGSFYLEMEPGIANSRNSGLANDLSRDQLLILDTAYDPTPGSRTAMAAGPSAPNRIVSTDFRLVGHWGPWRLYTRRASGR